MTPANDNDQINFFSVCSGIEAASVAWTPLGWKCVGVSEIEKFPSAVLAHHYPDVKNHGDFTAIDVTTLGRVDILCGGTPCQAFSVAGLRKSLGDARGNLSLSFVRLAHELAGIAEAGPESSGPVRGATGERQSGNGLRNVVWENVPGVLNTKDNAFGCFLGALVGADDAIVPVEPKPVDGKSGKWWRWSKKERGHQVKWPRHGMVAGPKGRAAWTVKDAQYFGLAQRRERVILVADFGNGADPFEVLFEPDGVSRDTPPSREARKDIAPTISARTKGGGGLGTDFDLDGGLDEAAMPVGHVPSLARCDATREGSSQDYETTTMVAEPRWSPEITATLETTSHDYSRADGFTAIVEPVCVTGTVTHTLKADGFDASEDGTGRGQPIVAFDTTQITSKANRSNPKAGDPCHPLSSTAHPPAITVAIRGRDGGGTAEIGGEVATALRASQGGGDKPHVLTSAVRRLTATECERLMGFPDDYTLIPWRKRPREQCPDGPRYKSLGNSWAVPKFRWLGERIQRLMPLRAANSNISTKQAA